MVAVAMARPAALDGGRSAPHGCVSGAKIAQSCGPESGRADNLHHGFSRGNRKKENGSEGGRKEEKGGKGMSKKMSMNMNLFFPSLVARKQRERLIETEGYRQRSLSSSQVFFAGSRMTEAEALKLAKAEFETALARLRTPRALAAFRAYVEVTAQLEKKLEKKRKKEKERKKRERERKKKREKRKD